MGRGSLPAVAPKGVRRTGLLSPSEAEVYPLVLAGLSNREIARRLGLEPHVANQRILRLCRAHGVRTVRELLARRIAELEGRAPETPPRPPAGPEC